LFWLSLGQDSIEIEGDLLLIKCLNLKGWPEELTFELLNWFGFDFSVIHLIILLNSFGRLHSPSFTRKHAAGGQCLGPAST